ncbi:trans-feruloyl-CoA hydratase / vanillin synthase [Anaerolineae bacterium]|nr:trans-feruloyl-CoA hydratase / vanillin synthase [Anaerolineae bacterium]
MEIPTYETILVNRDDGITTITFNRPEKRNCMSPKMHLEMSDALGRLKYDQGTHVLVLTGAGDSFCAGQDLKEYFYDAREYFGRQHTRDASHEWRSFELRNFPMPTIASINGWCFGGAFSTVCSCDLAIAAEEATFGLSEINFRHFPGGLVSKHVGDLFRPRDAAYYIFTGEPFNGKRAAEIGFVNYAVPLAKLKEETAKLAKTLREKDRTALMIAKQVWKQSLTMNYEQGLIFATAASEMHSQLSGGDWVEHGIGDFLKGKYKPGLESHKDKDGK